MTVVTGVAPIARGTEEYVIWCSLMAALRDVHGPVDTMTEEEWVIADRLCVSYTVLADAGATTPPTPSANGGEKP